MTTKIVGLDLETGGVDVASCQVMQVGLVPFYMLDGGDFFENEKLGRLSVRVKCEHPELCTEEALKVNGLNPNDGLSIEQARKTILDWADQFQAEGTTDEPGRKAQRMWIVGHGAAYFDGPILQRFLGSEEYQKRFQYRIRDTRPVVMFLADAGIISRKLAGDGLQGIAKGLGVYAGEKPHDAVSDAVDAVRVYEALVKKLGKFFESIRWANDLMPYRKE